MTIARNSGNEVPYAGPHDGVPVGLRLRGTPQSLDGVGPHVLLAVAGVPRAIAFFALFGARPIEAEDDYAVLQLVDGTKLVLCHGRRCHGAAAAAGFEIAIDDVPAVHALCSARGLRVSPIVGSNRRWLFTVAAPGGHALTVTSAKRGGGDPR